MHKLIESVSVHSQKILEVLDFFWKHPETGYKEWKGHAYLKKAFEELGYQVTEAGNVPGFYTDFDTGRPGPLILAMGELDALICGSHPDADPETGAVHCCGHACQAAMLYGLAAALKEPGAADGLCGRIRLMAVPAEELIEVEYREKLRQNGTIHYYGGKVEFMYRGFMDGVDAAFMVHNSSSIGSHAGMVNRGSNGCISKEIFYTGVSAHAGSAPNQGINALYAANQGLSAINALRETFKDSDHIRVHPIITYGGTVVNAIPERVCLESYIRGVTMDAILAANQKVNRALAASAAALGAKVHLRDRPGYGPRYHSDCMMALAQDAMEMVLEKVIVQSETIGGGCSDMGDVSMVMPAVHPYVGGTCGTGHGNDYFVNDPETAGVDGARMLAAMTVLLLENNGQRTAQIKKEFKPVFATMADYFRCMDAITMDKDAVIYNADGTVTLDFAQ